MKLPKSLLPGLSVLLCWFVVQIHARAQADSSAAGASTNSASSSVTTTPAVDPAKEAEIRKLLELTGTVKMVNQMLDQMITNFKMHNSNVPPEFWDRFRQEIDINGLVDKIIPVYDKYYTMDDLKAVNAFYETPAGQKVIATNPLVMRESMVIGQNWGREVGFKIQTEMAEEKEKAAAAAAASTPASNAAPTPAAPSTPSGP